MEYFLIYKNVKRQNIAPESYQELSEEKSNKKCQYGHERYKILAEHEKLVEYRKKIII